MGSGCTPRSAPDVVEARQQRRTVWHVNDVSDGSAEDQHYRGEDWYADDLGATRFVRCTFSDVDFSEVTSSGAIFDQCTFHGSRFNASTHTRSEEHTSELQSLMRT